MRHNAASSRFAVYSKFTVCHRYTVKRLTHDVLVSPLGARVADHDVHQGVEAASGRHVQGSASSLEYDTRCQMTGCQMTGSVRWQGVKYQGVK